MNIKNFLSPTMRKNIALLAFTGILTSSVLTGTTIPVNAAVDSQKETSNYTTPHSTSIEINDTLNALPVGERDTFTSMNQLIDNSIPDNNINNASDISFDSNISDSDLKINSFKMYNNGVDVEFFITYESGIDRYVIFFNPPNGDIFMKTSGTKLSAGKNNLKFKLPLNQYNMAKDGITMGFWGSNNTSNFIWFNPNYEPVINP